MSPQRSTLSIIGGETRSLAFHAADAYRSGMYRPEDNVYYRNNVTGNLDSFTYTFQSLDLTISSFISGMFFRKDNLNEVFFCDGSDILSISNNRIYKRTLVSNSSLLSGFSGSGTSRDLAWSTSSTISFRPEPSGLSFKSDGTSVVLCGNLRRSTSTTTTYYGAYIFQYNLSTAWNITSILGTSEFSGISPPNKILLQGNDYAGSSTLPTTDIIRDIYFHPDGTIFYYLRDNVLYQGSLSVSWNIGTNGENISSFNDASISLSVGADVPTGIEFNSTGTKLYITTRNAYILQYDLGTPWDLASAGYVYLLYVGSIKGEVIGNGVHSSLIRDDYMICLGSTVPTLYQYNVPVF